MIRCRLKFFSTLSAALLAAAFCLNAQAQTKAQGKTQTNAPRSAVQSFFTLLKSQKYTELYDYLPSQLQQQITREQLSASLKRLDSFLTIERMEIGRVQQRGDFAVVDTTIYGSLKRPMNVNGEEVKEGRTTVQQYLLKENGRWKVTTADNRTRDFFLKRNPEFKQQFHLTQPQFAFKQGGKQNGHWVEMGKPPGPPR